MKVVESFGRREYFFCRPGEVSGSIGWVILRRQNREGSFFAAFRTYPFEHIVDCVRVKTGRNIDHRYADRLEAIGCFAPLAVEMYMLVGHAVVRAALTEFIFKGAAAVFDDVHDLFVGKKLEYTEDARFVQWIEGVFQVGKADGMGCFHQAFHDKNAVGGRFHSFAVQQVFQVSVIHILIFQQR